MNKIISKKNRLSVLLHILAWLVLIILPQIIISLYSGSNNFISWGFYFNAAIFGIIFYMNYLWLIPRFYLNNRKALFFILTTALIICFYFVLDYTNQFTHYPERERIMAESIEQGFSERTINRPPFKLMQIYGYSLLSIIIVGFSYGLRVIEKHSVSEKRQKELEKEKLNSELAFLKNQVSPHFFFNTLNNIYSLIEINTSNAQEAVMKLSRLMRYLLYESEQGKTSLKHEINFMQHYIDLMLLRLSPKVDLSFHFPETDNNLEIPPLLFIPFIENAFKHGISYREKSFIHISMRLDENKILFTCKNSLGKSHEDKFDENHSGIGLENVKKRLGLLFPSSHVLRIDQTEGEFYVFLEIELKQE